jgi:hypothetical protein
MVIQVSGGKTYSNDYTPFRFLEVPPSVDRDTLITALVDEIYPVSRLGTNALDHFRDRIVVYSKQPNFRKGVEDDVWEVFRRGETVIKGRSYPAHYFELTGDIKRDGRFGLYIVTFWYGVGEQPLDCGERARKLETTINSGKLFQRE